MFAAEGTPLVAVTDGSTLLVEKDENPTRSAALPGWSTRSARQNAQTPFALTRATMAKDAFGSASLKHGASDRRPRLRRLPGSPPEPQHLVAMEFRTHEGEHCLSESLSSSVVIKAGIY